MYVQIKIDGINELSPKLNKAIRRELLAYFRLNLSVSNQHKWNDYFKDNGIKITINKLFIVITNTLKFTISEDNYVISINNLIDVSGYNLEYLTRLLNYGNLDIKGTYLITDGFDYLQRNINKIIKYGV